MSWQALQWALDCDKHKSVAEWAVLIAYADHADKRGYSWPSKRFIASRCRLHHTSVARAIEALIARKLIFRTKKRRGNTGQVEVLRMPKSCWESGLICDTFKSPQSGHKASYKRRTSGLICDTNLDTDNHEPVSIDNTLGVASTSGAQTASDVSTAVLVEKYQYQNLNRPARDHPKWPEFADWCATQRDRYGNPGKPTEAGFWKWLCGQKPQWRNTPQPAPAEQKGYLLNGKFYTEEQADQLGRADTDLLVKFQPAVKRNGRVLKLDTPTLKA